MNEVGLGLGLERSSGVSGGGEQLRLGAGEGEGDVWRRFRVPSLLTSTSSVGMGLRADSAILSLDLDHALGRLVFALELVDASSLLRAPPHRSSSASAAVSADSANSWGAIQYSPENCPESCPHKCLKKPFKN